jgi:anthranilate synthase component 2
VAVFFPPLPAGSPQPEGRKGANQEDVVAKLLVIDNYDSFTYNLVQMFMPYGLSIQVHRSDRISLNRVAEIAPDYILVSPGPKDPAHAGISKSLIQAFHQTTPILGVCLGMQCINEVFNGRTVRCPTPMHGKTSMVHHCNQALFLNMPAPFTAARYHSLAVEPAADALDQELIITGRTEDGTIMGLSHQVYPLHGVQFHPESFLTQDGSKIVATFLELGPLAQRVSRPPAAQAIGPPGKRVPDTSFGLAARAG